MVSKEVTRVRAFQKRAPYVIDNKGLRRVSEWLAATLEIASSPLA
jgi:hypothetical protein